MKFYKLIFVACLLATGLVSAQNSTNPWQISVGLTIPSINSDIVNSNGTVSSSDLSGSLGLPQASLYRKIFKEIGNIFMMRLDTIFACRI